MKVLFIGIPPEDNIYILKMLGTHFPKLKIISADDISNLSELMMNDGPFSFIIISLDNKNVVAIEVYQMINDILGTRPFVFIGSPKSVKAQLTNEMIQNQQTNSLIETPITLVEFKKAMAIAIDWVIKEEFEESILEFAKDDLHPMRIRNFYLFEQLPYDIYIELTATKYGRVISKNKSYTHQVIQNYSKKGIRHLYLKKDEYLSFLDSSIKNLIKIYENKLSERRKYLFLHQKTAYFIQQFIKAVSVSDEVISLTHSFIDSVSDIVRNYENLNELLHTLGDPINMTFAEQSVATAYVCESIILKMGWSADMTRGKLMLAALLQDVGLNNDDLIKIRSLNDPHLKMFSEEEQNEFRDHPSRAAKIATYFTGFSDVDFILIEQHEHPTGGGFPKGLNSSGLTTISCIFILASNFVSRISEGAQNPNGHREILLSMKKIYNSGNFKDPLKALERALKK